MKRFVARVTLVTALAFSALVADAGAQVNREFSRPYANGRIYQASKRLPSPRSFRLTTYYADGSLLREEVWANGKRNGLTRVFLPKNVLVKEMHFHDDYLVDYTAYVNGAVYTKISADRLTMVNKGRPVAARWDHYYEVNPDGHVFVFTRKSLADWMVGWLVPEDVTQRLADLGGHYDSLAGRAGATAGDDMVTCGGATSLANDFGRDFTSIGALPGGRFAPSGGLPSGTLPGMGSPPSLPGPGSLPGGLGGMPAPGRTAPGAPSASDALAGIAGSCGQAAAAGGHSGSGGGQGGGMGGGVGAGADRQSNIDKARASLDKAISDCESRGAGGSSLIAAGGSPPFKSLDPKVQQAVADAGKGTADPWGGETVEEAAVRTETMSTEVATTAVSGETTVVDGAALAADSGSAVASGSATAVDGAALAADSGSAVVEGAVTTLEGFVVAEVAVTTGRPSRSPSEPAGSPAAPSTTATGARP